MCRNFSTRLVKESKYYPVLAALEDGIPPEYVYIETKRAVEATNAKLPAASDIGIGIPWNGDPYPSSPESVYKATQPAFRAGAKGVVASRHLSITGWVNARRLRLFFRQHFVDGRRDACCQRKYSNFKSGRIHSPAR